MQVEHVEVNGLPALVGSIDGRVVAVLAAHVAAGRIAGLWLSGLAIWAALAAALWALTWLRPTISR